MSEDKDFFQTLSGEMITFLEWAYDSLGDPLAREAVLRDLGGEPSKLPAPQLMADGKLDAARAFRDASHPSAEAAISALADLATLVDGLAGQVETWVHSPAASNQDNAHLVLELFATNFVRLRFPRLFLVMQAVSILEEVTSTYGPGNNNGMAFLSSLCALGKFLWQPGRALEQLDPGPDAPPDRVAETVDFLARVAAVVVAAVDSNDKLKSVADVMTGWDGPGVDEDSTSPPLRADVVAGRMTSISLGFDSHEPSTELATAGRVMLTTATVHAVEGGPALFLALGGNASVELPVGDRWTLSLKSRMDAAVALLLGGLNKFDAGGGNFEFSIGYAANPPAPTPDRPPSQVAFAFPSPRGTRLEVGHLAFTLSLTSAGAEVLARVSKSALLVDPSDQDGFTAELLGNTPVRLPLNVTIGYSTSRGLVLEGSGAEVDNSAPLSGSGNVGTPVIAATIPVGRAVGPVTIHEVGVRLIAGRANEPLAQATQFAMELDASFSAQIGPVYFRMDQLGIQLALDTSKPPRERNLRLLDLRAGAKFPRGIAVHIETALVAGGGSILHDPDQGIYFGTMDLAIRGGLSIQAICLVATRTPEGSKGFSMVAMLTIEFGNPWPLGMGFFLQGVGGMVAVHRTFDEGAMRAALPTGQLRNVLFHPDPVHHTAEILRALQTLFPARRGSHMVGLLAKIGWASPTLVQFELGLLYQWGQQHRLIILGRVSATLPSTDQAALKLNMDAVGVLDFDAGTFALDAVLYDSKLCGRFVITGAMVMRMGFKEGPGFAIAVGGLHPRYNAGTGFPTVSRLQLALTNGDNPKLICRAYFAITSNTVQFGADASLYAAAFGFSLEGNVGFDVLIQLLPFHFLAEFRASVQLKRGSHNLFKVSVAGELEGPLPLRVAGKATFEILWCDYSVKFNATLVDRHTVADLVLLDVLDVLVTSLSEPRSWQAQLTGEVSQVVSLRQPPSEAVLLHPLGTLTVRQTVVPLGRTRDIDRVGTATPSTDRRFAITAASIGPQKQAMRPVQELFAPGQFFDMSDDDRLAAPSFESMDAGVSFGDGGYTAGPAAASPFDYTDIVVDANGTATVQPAPYRPQGPTVLVMTMVAATAAPRVRRTLDRRFATTVRPEAPLVNPGGWTAVKEGAAAATDATQTWAESRGRGSDRAGWVLVPRGEVVV